MDADAIAMEKCGDDTPSGYGDSSDDNKDALLEEELTTDASGGRRESINSIWLTICLLIYFRNYDDMICITYRCATGLCRLLKSFVVDNQDPLILHNKLIKFHRNFRDDILKRILRMKKYFDLNFIDFSLRVQWTKPILVQVMAWWWTGEKPLPGAILTRFTKALCDTRERWVKP